MLSHIIMIYAIFTYRIAVYPEIKKFGVEFSPKLLENVEPCFGERKFEYKEEIKNKSSCQLCNLRSLRDNFLEFFQCLHPEDLIFFLFFVKVNQSDLLKYHMKNELQSSRVTMEELSFAIRKAKEIAQSILNGNIMYKQLFVHLDINLQAEFFSLEKSVQLKVLRVKSNQNAYQCLKDLLQVFEFAHHIDTLKKIFEKFELLNIAKDPNFISFHKETEGYRDDPTKISIELSEATAMLAKLKTKLSIEKSSDSHSLDALACIEHSQELFKFIVSKDFYGDIGLNSFHQQYHLITTSLQHLEYDENVLNNLPAAVKLIAPFYSINKAQGDTPFFDLMQAIKDSLRCGSKELDIVNKNMSLVHKWFSQANVSFII